MKASKVPFIPYSTFHLPYSIFFTLYSGEKIIEME